MIDCILHNWKFLLQCEFLVVKTNGSSFFTMYKLYCNSGMM